MSAQSAVQFIVAAEDEAGHIRMDRDLVQKVVGKMFSDATTRSVGRGEDVDNTCLALFAFAQDCLAPGIEVLQSVLTLRHPVRPTRERLPKSLFPGLQVKLQ